eukprot:5729421-Pyramimonas_sp.AAC.1
MLLSEVASSGRSPRSTAQCRSRLTDTCVLPVPGGPCTSDNRRVSPADTASRCEWFRLGDGRGAPSRMGPDRI